MSAGSAAFNVPQDWQEVTVPQGEDISPWDWVMQDTPDFTDESVTCRLLVITREIGDVVSSPPDSAEDLASTIAATRVFGGGLADLPYEVEGYPDQVWRTDHRIAMYSTEDKEERDHVLVAQDDGRPEIAVIGLTGSGITEDLLTTFAAGIEVLHD